MDKLHQNLMKNSSWYQTWHKQPHHQKAQWVVFVLVAVAFGGLVLTRIQQPSPQSYGLQTHAQVKDESNNNRTIALEAQIPEQTRYLIDLVQALKKAPADQRDAILDELTTLAQSRHNNFSELLKLNPGAALNNSINPGLRNQMPAEIQALVEQKVTVSGTFDWTHSDNFKNRTETDAFTLTDRSHKKYNLHLTADPEVVTGAELKVTGLLLDTDLAVDSVNSSSFQVLATTAAPSVIKKIAVLMVNFQNNNPQPYTADFAKNEVFNKGRVFYENSSFGQWTQQGKVSAAGDVYGWYTIPYNLGTTCDTNTWADAADAAAAAAGVDLSGYDNKIYGLIDIDYGVCGFTGRATLGGNRVWINGGFGMDAVVTDHELGHNYAMSHAASYICHDGSSSGPLVSISNYCTIDEYGDPYDVMGGGSGDFSNYHKGNSYGATSTHWLTAANTVTLTPTPNTSATYLIEPVEIASSGIQSLRIPRGSEYYYLEFRQPVANDVSFGSSNSVTNGVSIRLAPDYSVTARSKLIDTNAATSSFYDSALTTGQTFTDPSAGLTITTNSVSTAGASVTVSFSATSCVHSNPTITLTPSSQTGAKGQTLTYTMSVTNNDNSNCLSSLFTVNSVVPSGWFVSPNPINFTLAPGATFGTPVNVTSYSSASAGSYNISQTVTNNDQPAYTATTSATYAVAGDSTPPTVTITSPVNGATVPIRSTLTITANATDNVSVNSVTFYLNNTFIKGCTDYTAPYTCSWKVPAQKGKTYQFSARALDPSGNAANSPVVTVTAQ